MPGSVVEGRRGLELEIGLTEVEGWTGSVSKVGLAEVEGLTGSMPSVVLELEIVG